MFKFIQRSIATLLIAILIPTTALAEEPLGRYYGEFVKENFDIVGSFNGSNLNELLHNYFIEFVDSSLASSSHFLNPNDYDASNSEAKQAVIDLIADETKSRDVIFGNQFPRYNDNWEITSPQVNFIAFQISPGDFEQIVLPYLEEQNTNELPADKDAIAIYAPADTSAAFAYIKPQLVIAENLEQMQTIVDNLENPEIESLDGSVDFIDQQESFLYNNFFELYINKLSSFAYGDEDIEEVLSSIKSEGISIKETNNGFWIQADVIQNPKEDGSLPFEFTDKKLSIQNYLPSEKPILAMMTSEMKPWVKMIKESDSYEENRQEQLEETGIDYGVFVDSLSEEIAFLVHDDGKLCPSFTFMKDVNHIEEAYNAELAKLLDYIWNETAEEAQATINKNTYLLEEDEDAKLTLERNTANLDAAEITQFTFQLELKPRKNPYAPTLPSELLQFTISVGTSSDGIAFISTSNDILTSYGEGLENVPTDNDQYFLLNFQNINGWLQNFISILEEALPGDFQDFTRLKEVLNQIFEPLGHIETSGNSFDIFISSLTEISIDLAQAIENWSALSEESFTEMSSHNEKMNARQKDFTDVESTEWYGDNVYYLSSQGVINGYPDGTYGANLNVNRAEFITLVVNAIRSQRTDFTTSCNPDYSWAACYEISNAFDDVSAKDWFAATTYAAYENGLLEGLEYDRAFAGSTEISRAEAAQIIANAMTHFNINYLTLNEESAPKIANFTDVPANASYKQAVQSLYELSIIQGTSATTFSPNKILNRAETASLIRKMMELL